MNRPEKDKDFDAVALSEGAVPPKPPRARVEDAGLPGGEPAEAAETRGAAGDPASADAAGAGLPRTRDYLDGFLRRQPENLSPAAPGGVLHEAVIAALKEIYDPEIPVNIYDLGLIYGVEISEDGDAVVTMTLTTPHCPVAESMPGEVEIRVASVPGVRDAQVNLVWDPPWGPDKMTDEARLELGML